MKNHLITSRVRSFLAILVASIFSLTSARAAELISNGGFESGTTSWTMAGPVVPSTGLYPHSGTKYAVMGELNSITDTMYQQITIPTDATAATLTYWYNITSAEGVTTAYDILTVTVKNTSGSTLATVDDTKSNINKDPAGGNPYYHQITPFNLLPYKGQTVRIHFQVVTDPSTLTSFKIDDVSVSVTTATCSYSISPSSASPGASSGSGSFSMTAGSGCSWSASTAYSWIHTTSSASGSGTVSYTYDANTSTSSRSGTITAGGQTFTITQAGNTTQRLTGKKIGVDPGHGDPPTLTTSGASGPTGLTERSVNLATALALKKYLEADGATVFMTRSTAQDVSYSYRSSLFINNAVDFGISVHQNGGAASSDTTMAFIYCGASLTKQGSLASAIVQRLATSTGIPISQAPASTADTLCSGRSDWQTGIGGVGQANLYMVRVPEEGGIPSVLVEVSFITNPDEETKLRDADYLDKNGWAIYAGVADYYGFTPIPRNGNTDVTKPTISALGVAPLTINVGSSLTISYTVSDSGGSGLKQVQLWRANVDGTSLDPSWQSIGGAITLSGNGPISSTFTDTPSVVENYWYGLHVLDNANNLMDERTAGRGPVQASVLSRDTTPPAVSITSPSSGTSYATAQTVNIIASASDASGLSKVDFYDGSTFMGSNPMGPYAISWSFTSANNGTHNWTARAYDTAGNSATSSVVSLTINIPLPDTTPPTVSIGSPTSGQTFTTSPVAVSGTAADSGSPSTGVSVVQVQVNGTGGTWQTASGTAIWNTLASLTPGANTIYVRSQDGAGNYSATGSVNVTYTPDTQGPALTISSPANGAVVTSASLPVSGTASDSGLGNNGISSITVNGISANGGTASGSATANWNTTIVTLAPGANTITVIAKDTLNNSTQKQITIIYNQPETTPPALTIASPVNGAVVTSASLPVSGTASDSGLGNNGISSVTVNGANTGATASGSGTASWNATVSLVSGVNTITVVAKDTLNNSTQKVVSVTYNPPETTPPALTIITPANNAVVTSASLLVSGTASDSGLGNNGISAVTVGGFSASGGTASGTGTANWNATVTLVSGVNTITVVAKDTLNNSTQKVIIVTYTDTTPPTVSISSPTSGQTFTTSPVTVSGTASDPGSPSTGVSLVQVQVDGTGGTWQTASGTTSWSTSVALSSGANTIYVRSQDGAGNYSSIASVTVTLGVLSGVVFFDDMENGQGAWTMQAPWGLTTASSHSPNHSWTDSPGGNYPNNTNVSLISPLIDLTGKSAATLTFWHRFDFAAGDGGYIWILPQGGSLTTPLRSFVGTDFVWHQESIDLSNYVGQVVTVFFQLLSDSSGVADGWYVDDVAVSASVQNQLTGMKFNNGAFRFVLNGSVGSRYVIQVSSNLVNWLPLSTNIIPAGGSVNITNSGISNLPRRFYRVLPLAAGATPANDLFANRILITGTNVTVSGSNVGASMESGEPFHWASTGGKSVWWTWQAPKSGTVTISTAGSSFDTLLAAYTGNSVGGLTLIQNNDDFGDFTSQVSFSATTGVVYQIAVDGFGAETGSISLWIQQ